VHGQFQMLNPHYENVSFGGKLTELVLAHSPPPLPPPPPHLVRADTAWRIHEGLDGLDSRRCGDRSMGELSAEQYSETINNILIHPSCEAMRAQCSRPRAYHPN
jgi:hypothetical protein